MKVSVIIPVYNAEKTLRRCVESIIYGLECSVQVILVDDCSLDGSWELCQQLKGEYSQVNCIKNDRNRGVSYTRNQGLKKALGKYILFVDSDDWVSGKYVSTLLQMADQQPDSLILCGFYFVNQMQGYKEVFLFDHGEKNKKIPLCTTLFDLKDKVHLQQLWNKIFRRDVIEKAHIHFDENQSMGEDFQFILDYMEAAEIQECVVINQPLYYYIRWNNTSLMSHFGTTECEHEYRRLEQLLRLCGNITSESEKRYERALADIKRNYVYQAVHGKNNKAEILNLIEAIMQDGKAEQHYRIQKKILIKEQIHEGFSWVMMLPDRFYGRMQRKRRDKLAVEMKAKLQTKDFTVLSQNCIGGVFYHDMGLQFTSPTINLYLTGKDFVAFVLNLDYYLSLKLRMTWGEECPIGYLDDIAIYFMHYRTCQEAESAWERRKKRINREKIVVLCTDMEDFTDEVYVRWRQIPYPKVLFTAKRRYANDLGTVFFSEYEKNGKVPDLISKREFYRDGVLMKTVNCVEDDRK